MSGTTVVTAKPFAWSYSALKNYETCAKRYYHYNVVKDVYEPETPQLAEGNALHKAFADRLARGTPLPIGLRIHEKMLSRLAAGAKTELAVEQKMAITSGFQPCAYMAKDVWLRGQIDVMRVLGGDTAAVIDWKNGQPKEDFTQLQINAALVFAHMPEINTVRSSLLFVQHDRPEFEVFYREGLVDIWNDLLPRVRALEAARKQQEYPPKPSGLCKKYCMVTSCPYHGRGDR
jgi:hypothetical protein